jgi:hypothetical protein
MPSATHVSPLFPSIQTACSKLRMDKSQLLSELESGEPSFIIILFLDVTCNAQILSESHASAAL